jgi:hypothetical protein
MAARHRAPPLAPRSANPPAALIRRCCLRCSKRLAADPGLDCLYSPGGSKCDRCTRLHKACGEIPARLVHRANQLILASDRYWEDYGDDDVDDNDDAQDALIELNTQQRDFTMRVEAEVRRAARHGQARAPQNTLEGIMVLVAGQDRIQESLNNLVDVLRWSVS